MELTFEDLPSCRFLIKLSLRGLTIRRQRALSNQYIGHVSQIASLDVFVQSRMGEIAGLTSHLMTVKRKLHAVNLESRDG